MPQVVAPLERNPFEVFLLALCAYSGTRALLAGLDTPGVPPLVTLAWNGLLVSGATVGLAGHFWPDRLTGLLIVRAAMIPFGAGAYLYAIPVGMGLGTAAAVVIVAFGLTAHWRAFQISRLIRRRPL